MLIEQYLMLALPCLLLLLALTVARRNGKSAGYELSLCLFWVYLCEIASFTLAPFSMQFNHAGEYFTGLHLVPALMEGNPDFRPANIQVWGNFLIGVPFGVEFPFVASEQNCTFRHRAGWGLVLAIAPEILQLSQNLFMDGFGRSVDIDDVWLCFTGTLVGYGWLYVVARLYHRLNWSRGASLPIWNHFHEVLMRVAAKPVTASIALQNAKV